MYTSVLEVGQKQIDRFFKVFIVFDELLIDCDIGHGSAAADAVGIDLGNGIQQRRQSLTITPLALPKTKFEHISTVSAVRRCLGIFTKPFTLMIRLFANIMAGHSIMLGMTCIIFLTASISMAVCSTMSAVAVFFMIFMNCLELLVAFIPKLA